MSSSNQNSKSAVWGVVYGIMVSILLLMALALGYFIYNSNVNSADNYGTDFYHKFNYCQSVKKCGSRYLNVKWPFVTDSSWNFDSLEYNGKTYVIGTCKVSAEGDPEKIDVVNVFSLQGREVENAFFAAGGKIYYDGIGLTDYLITEVLGDTMTFYQEDPGALSFEQ